jgi:hypothetical protein
MSISSNITTKNDCTYEKYPPRWKDLRVCRRVPLGKSVRYNESMQSHEYKVVTVMSISLTTSLRVAPSGWERERYTQVVVQQVNNEGK